MGIVGIRYPNHSAEQQRPDGDARGSSRNPLDHTLLPQFHDSDASSDPKLVQDSQLRKLFIASLERFLVPESNLSSHFPQFVEWRGRIRP